MAIIINLDVMLAKRKMTSPVTMKKVSDLRTPFSPKYHKLIWYDNYVELILYEETIRIPLK